MRKEQIKAILQRRLIVDGVVETGITGLRLFRVTDPMQCAPAVYEPTVVAIVSGTKEAILDGAHYRYDHHQYLCCSVSMPVEAGTPQASPQEPLLGVIISLDTKVMTELVIEMENANGGIRKPKEGPLPLGLQLAPWDDGFAEALLRLLQVTENASDCAVLGAGRLRELYYAVLKGAAGESAQRAFGVGNEIARTIDYLSSRLDQPVSIDEMASQVGMSKAVFHRKFKQATTLTPIQFVKSMRLNRAAMEIASGRKVSQAAMAVGYVSSSQFSREFKRMYGQSPKQWRNAAGP